MNVTPETLAKLENVYDGYLEGEAVTAFLADFGIRLAAGHWCAGEFVDRFCPVGYNSDDPAFDPGILAQIERVKNAGLEGIEFHEVLFLDAHGARDQAAIDAVKDALARHGIRATNMNFNTWTAPKYKFGGITHPDPGRRREALDQILLGVEIAKEIGCGSAGLWPGSDGWDYHFEVDYGQRMRWFIDGCTAIAAKCDELGLQFGTEPKQKEPREMNMITNTVAKAACVCMEVNRNLGKTVMGVSIDYGHEQMVGNTPGESVYFLKTLGIPIANFHINGAKFNSNDEDRIAGTDDVWRLVEFCYAAVDCDYQGWFGEDQFTYRTDQTISMHLSREFFANCMKKALKLYARKAELAEAQATGDAVRTIQTVKKVIYNG